MLNTPTPQATKGEAGRKFVQAMKQLLSVPKGELDKREAAYQQERATKKALRKSKLIGLLLLASFFLCIQSVVASPEERASILKARILKNLVEDGWQLVQESQSLLIVERPMTGWGGPVVQALTTGAYGTKPIIRWSVTVIPETDNYTRCNYSATVNSQNAFGQMNSIPINNKKNLDYMNRLTKAASDAMPARYKFKEK